MIRKLMALTLAALLLLSLPLHSLAASFSYEKAICLMTVQFQCGCSRYGTGAMIGRRGLITAGHNLVCLNHSRALKSCTFLFGAKSANSGTFKITVKNGKGYTARWYDSFSGGYSSSDDIGFVVFEKPVGDSTGWFGWWAGSDYDMNEEFMNTFDYDGRGRLKDLFTVQYVLDSKRLYWDGHLWDTQGGPVVFDQEGMDWPQVVAVSTTYDTSKNRGYGRRITMNVINDMRAMGAFN